MSESIIHMLLRIYSFEFTHNLMRRIKLQRLCQTKFSTYLRPRQRHNSHILGPLLFDFFCQ